VPTDAAWLRKRLHSDKLATSYCWKTLLNRRVPVAGGSDAPVETVSPFQGMFDAIFRPERVGKTDEMLETACYMPDECLNFSEALYLYTIGAAYAACTEDRRGRLQVGFDADFVVVDLDLNENPRALARLAEDRNGDADENGLQVWVGGELRFDRKTEETSNNVTVPTRSDAAPGRGGPNVLATSIFRTQRPDPMRCACHGHA
jgi:imidazolonepropionase-like amidohydrolase